MKLTKQNLISSICKINPYYQLIENGVITKYRFDKCNTTIQTSVYTNEVTVKLDYGHGILLTKVFGDDDYSLEARIKV